MSMSEKSPWEGRLGVEVIGKTQGCCVDTILKWRPQMVGQKRSCTYCNVTMKVIRASEVITQEFTGGLNEYRRELIQPELVIGGLYFSIDKFASDEAVGNWLEDREIDADADVVVELDNFAHYVALERLMPESVRHLWVAPGVVGELGVAEKQVATGGGQASMHSPGVTVASMNAGTLHPAQGPAAIAGGAGKMPSVLHGMTQMTDGHQHEFHLVPFPAPDGWRVKGYSTFNNGHTHMIDAALNADGTLDARTAPDQAPVGGHAHSHRVVWHASMNLPGGPPPNPVPADTSNDGTTGKDMINNNMLNEFRQQLSEAILRAQVKVGKSTEDGEDELSPEGTPGSLGDIESENKGEKPESSSKAPAGEGGRFRALAEELATKEKSRVRDPKDLAAAIGRAKYGKEKFQEMAAAGRKKN
jgi:hypothetical protein